MRDVAEWLAELGLGRYLHAFEANEIDFDALPHLNNEMLQQIGIPIGPRIKLLLAIAQLASPPDPRLEVSHTKSAVTPQRQHSERRQLTVLFCDVVDSTRLARTLDPEDLKFVMESYRTACGEVIKRHGGHVDQYRGDSIEAFFGWPVAHEDAAESAVRAGLEIVAAVQAAGNVHGLSVRIAINTGIVVTGETGYGDSLTPSGVFGDAPYIAARLQTIAMPNTVVIAETTSRLVAARFILEALGPQDLKGIPEPIQAFQVQQVREDVSRFQVAHATALTPLVNRRAELAWLRQHWYDAKVGDGRVVFLSGVPGIGKSRLVHELESSIKHEPHFDLRFQCLPHNTQSPLFPVIQQLRKLAGLASEDSNEAKLDKIQRLFTWAAGEADKAIPLVAELISVPTEAVYLSPGRTPMQTKNQTLLALIDLLIGLSKLKPVFCLVEDAQWLDASSQELLDQLVDQIGRGRVLVVVTHRPDYQPRLGPKGDDTALTISRLPRRDVTEMVKLALRERAVSTSLINRIVDGSDSVPLFVEELARGVLDSTGRHAQGPFSHLAELSASWSVPDSLRDSLAARLDKAPQAKSVAQTASVLGREFSYDILLRVSGLNRAELNAALAHLQQSEIVQQTNTASSPQYSFRHALVRDAAYESSLKSSRREIHAKVAASIEQGSPEIVADEPELLAHHYSFAGDAESATRYWLIGGHRARGRSANLEAIAQYENAIETLQWLPQTPERDEIELDIQLSLGLCFLSVRGYSSDDTRKSFERAYALSATVGGPVKELRAIFGLWGHYWMAARHDCSIELGEILLAKAAPLRDPAAIAIAHRALGSTLFTQGDFVKSKEHLEIAISITPEQSIERISRSFAVDPRVAALLVLAKNLWMLGFPEQALDRASLALELASDSAEPYSIAFAHYVISAVQLLRGEWQQSLDNANLSLSVSSEHRINLYEAYSRIGRGCALARLGQPDAITEIRRGIQEADRSGLGYLRGFMLGWLATLQMETGDPDDALLTIDGAIMGVNDVTGRAWEAELHRLRGTILVAARPDAIDEAARSYANAIAVAQRQSARSIELRAAVSLARLQQRQGRDDDARALLAPIYGWFSEGFDTADLREARALLDRR